MLRGRSRSASGPQGGARPPVPTGLFLLVSPPAIDAVPFVRADTSPPGSSRRRCRTSTARASGRCATRRRTTNRRCATKGGTPMPGDAPGQAQGSGSTTVERPARPGLIRSIAHRLAGELLALPDEGRLPGFDGATGWLNSSPLSPEALRGRVVLVDFWTYTCVNWLRTLPYVRAWSAKYGGAGLTVVGVHTPEFGFEHDVDNVTANTRRFGVDWPVAIDNDYGVWRAFENHFWPALYLADATGRLRYHHFGEGEYAAAEMAIQQLLMEAGAEGIDQELVMVDPQGLEVAADWRTLQSPETYAGYGQATGFAQDHVARFDEP